MTPTVSLVQTQGSADRCCFVTWRFGPCAEDLLPAAYLTCGKIAPEHEGVELNVGGSVISAAIREATGVTRQRLHAMYDSLGDPGDVAEACRHTQVRCNH